MDKIKKQNNRRFKESKDRKTTNYIIIVVALIILLSTPLLISFSRYAIKSVNNYFSRSREFYFLSDKLTVDNNPYIIDNWSGVDPYTVVVNMSSMKNSNLKTNYDIAYDISYTASSNLNCQISKTSGVIPATTNEDSFNLIMTPNISLFDGDTVEVKDLMLYVNGTLCKENYNTIEFQNDFQKVTVPKGKIFVMGDNRPISLDSRYTEVGFINPSNIEGKVILFNDKKSS